MYSSALLQSEEENELMLCMLQGGVQTGVSWFEDGRPGGFSPPALCCLDPYVGDRVPTVADFQQLKNDLPQQLATPRGS